MENLFNNWKWQAPANFQKITTIDMHTGGEPLRVITSGLPELKGKTVLEKRKYFREHHDHLRTGLLWEPRGHADMYGAILSSSTNADADVFFLHNEGYSTMCGHAVIALTKLLLESGMVKKEGDHPGLILNVPCGQIRAFATFENGRATNISFLNVPSFVYLQDHQLNIPGMGTVKFDIAYGGAFYAFVEAEQLGLQLQAHNFNQLVDYGRRIKQAVMHEVKIKHPFEDDLSFLYGTIFTGIPNDSKHHSRNVCIFAEGEVDRSSTGSGVSARAALHYAKGDLPLNESITIESITGSTMTVKATATCAYGPYNAVIPQVGGSASITGQHEFYFDPEDPFRRGFIFR
jgi:trans-L-3-hydroxyproline dehydratase